MKHTFTLVDDGTLDTVFRCDDCGSETRFNYAANALSDEDAANRRTGADEEDYEAWKAECIEELEDEHECEPEDDEPSEPEESDITTTDHRTFRQDGKPVLQQRTETAAGSWFEYWQDGRWLRLGVFSSYVAALRAYMDKTQFWPNAWFISDHGNAHLIDLNAK